MSVIIDSDNNNVNITEEPINVTVSLGGPDVAAVWGGITGDITEQTDLQTALDGKVDKNAAITGATKTKITYDSKGLVTAGADAGISDIAGLQTALDDKVPYTGATGNVDLGEYELKAGQIELDTTPTGTAGVAVTRWNNTVGTIETTLKGGNVVLKHGRDMFERVVNKTGVQLTRAAYQAVRISTAQGQRLGVALARANNDMNSADTIGLAVETIDNNQEGIIYTVGEIDGINTTGSLQGETWADGDVLYLSPDVAGRITNVKPVAPEHLVVIGYVVYAHQNNGKIYVKVMNGWELGELHDVDTTGATNGQVLTYNGSIWTPATNGSGTVTSIATSAPITGGTITSSGTIGITQAGAASDGYLSSVDWNTFNNKQAALTNPVTGTGTAGQVSYWSGTNTQTGSNNLFWDAVNNRLGVGTPTPGASFETTLGMRMSGSGQQSFEFSNATRAQFRAIFGGFSFRSSTGLFISNADGDPTARLHVRGSGTTSATTALLVQNSTPSELLTVRDDGAVFIGNVSITQRPYFAGYTNLTEFGAAQRTLGIVAQFIAGNKPDPAVLIKNSANLDYTSGTGNFLGLILNYSPTSGTGVFNNFNIQPTINQTGGANGITRGIYVNPTLTAAADWRSIEFSNNTGYGIYGAGTANNYLGGRLGVGITTPSTLLEVSGLNGSNIIRSTTTSNLGSTAWVGQTAHDIQFYNADPSGPGIYSAIRVIGGPDSGNVGREGTADYDLTIWTGGYTRTLTERLRVNSYGNVSIGTTTSSGRVTIQGSGTTSATKAFVVNNATPTALLEILDNGRIDQTIPSSTNTTIFGSAAGAGNLTGSGNSFFGTGSGNATTTGANNAALGFYSGLSNTTGSNNVFFGSSAGRANVDGSRNIFIGNTAGRFITDGTTANTKSDDSVFIGSDTRAAANTQTNQIVIGYQAIGNGSNTATLGNTSITDTYLRGNVNYTDGGNFIFGTTTGTKIGTSTSQKLGLWNATPIVQPTTAVAAATRVAGGGTTVTDTDTFDGYTIAQIVKALRNIGALA